MYIILLRCVRIGFTAFVYNITRLRDGLRRKRAFSVCTQYMPHLHLSTNERRLYILGI